MTPQEIGAATIGALVVLGAGAMAVIGFWKKLGIGRCPETCPDSECQSVVQSTHTEVVKLTAGQNNLKEQLEQKRIKIEGLQSDTTEIKTDVKWIVRELRGRNDT